MIQIRKQYERSQMPLFIAAEKGNKEIVVYAHFLIILMLILVIKLAQVHNILYTQKLTICKLKLFNLY